MLGVAIEQKSGPSKTLRILGCTQLLTVLPEVSKVALLFDISQIRLRGLLSWTALMIDACYVGCLFQYASI